MERSFREVDRLGFTPMQRVLRPAEQACGLRAPVFADLLGTGLDRNSEELETSLRIDSLPRRLGRGLLLRLRPLTEQVEVVRRSQVDLVVIQVTLELALAEWRLI